MWVLIDNYDSFTHILLHYLLREHDDIQVWRNDEITIEELRTLAPQRIILSPGPQTPAEAGITNEVIRHFYHSTPILGVCLGHQAIGMHFGATLHKATIPMHGKVSRISVIQQHPLFEGVPVRFEVMRYHSLIIGDWENTEIIPLALTGAGELMAFCHERYPVVGLQFHPESILTEYGREIIRNWATMSFS